jgi:predicted HTH transcriptional regulator
MEKYLKKLIDSGESQKLDFKYCISDSRKIARTLSAFSNSEGGILLIGIRDNGSVAGVRSDEEYYMIETAASIYCKPEIPVTTRQHIANGKTVLEVEVMKGDLLCNVLEMNVSEKGYYYSLSDLGKDTTEQT